MSGVTGVSSLNNTYANMSSGKRINSAKDDAAGLAIAKKEEAAVGGYTAGARNIESGKSLINVSDAVKSNIGDSLQRLRELSLQAQNTALYGDDDLMAMQDEADALIAGIDDMVKNATFNGKNLMEGEEFKLTGEGNSVTSVKTDAINSETLGIKGLVVSDAGAVKALDEAINKLAESRSQDGASYNSLNYQQNNNSLSSLNASASQSKIEDLDYSKAVSDKKKDELLMNYSIQMQKKQSEQEENMTRKLLGLS